MIFYKKYVIIYIESKGKAKVIPMIINKFYAAYAVRHFVSHKDIVGEANTFEEADALAKSYLCDDDDEGVFVKVRGLWYRVWGRDPDTNGLVVSDEYGGWDTASVRKWY